MHMAAEGGHDDVVTALLQAGAKVDELDKVRLDVDVCLVWTCQPSPSCLCGIPTIDRLGRHPCTGRHATVAVV